MSKYSTYYLRGTGFVKERSSDKIYLKKYLERDSITGEEYKRFKKKWYILDRQIIILTHKKSIVEKVLRKRNTHNTDIA